MIRFGLGRVWFSVGVDLLAWRDDEDVFASLNHCAEEGKHV